MTGERRTEYEIRDGRGILRAIHVRRETADGKIMSWRSADGTIGLGGRPVVTLPLYGSHRVPGWPSDTWIVVTEGEADCDALTRVGVPALGTVTGAACAPTPQALADVAMRRRFIVWPDNDDAGRGHMALVAANLYRAGADTVRVVWCHPAATIWPKGAGAADLVGGHDPEIGALLVSWLVGDWSVPVTRPSPTVTPIRPAPRPMPHRDTGSVSDALIAVGVLNAKPGRTVRCPHHDDHHASLSILRDDRRAICKSGSCEWSGRGVWAADIDRLVTR